MNTTTKIVISVASVATMAVAGLAGENMIAILALLPAAVVHYGILASVDPDLADPDDECVRQNHTIFMACQ